MRGMKILGFLGLVFALTFGYLMWPSDAITERKSEDLKRQLGITEELLSEVSELVREVAKKKPANRLKRNFEVLNRSVALIRHRQKNLEADPEFGNAKSLVELREIGTALEVQYANVADLRARVSELLNAIDTLSPLVAEANRLRRILEAKASELSESGENIESVKELRETIQASSNHESLVLQAFEKFSDSIVDGRVMAGTAKNELQTVLARMRELAEDS